MTEKRFSIWDCNSMENILNTFVQDSEKEGQESTLLTHQECCDLLNDFHEENQTLKQQVNELIDLMIDSGIDFHISDEMEWMLE